MAKLTITSGGKESQVDILEDRFVIGRAPTCSLVIEDTASSRKHCEIEKTAKGWRITDLDSSNGTKVNGTKIERAPLATGDVIAIGKTKIRFDEAPAPATAAGPEAEDEIELSPPEPEEEEIELGGAGDESSGFLLLVTAGEQKDREHSLIAGENRIGRSKKNRISLPDTGVSGVHAGVSIEAGQATVRDLGSTNGTLVNGERLSGQRVLQHGDRIQVGVARLLFVDAARREAEGLAAFDEDAGESEEGLEISTLDAGRAGSRRGSFALVVVLLLVLGGGGYFAYSYLPTVTSEAAPVLAPPAGSLLTRGWSFEDDDHLDLWQTAGRSARSRVRTDDAVTGSASLCLAARGEGVQAQADCTYSEDLSVSSLGAYEVSGHILSRDAGALGLLKLEWWAKVGSGETFLGELYGNPVTATGNRFVESAFVAVPPSGATHARIGCVTLGPDAVCCFDEIAVIETDRAAGELHLDATSEHRLSLTDRGVFRLVKGTNFYLGDGEFVAVREGSGDGSIKVRQALHFGCEEPPDPTATDRLRFAGALHGGGGDPPAVEQTVTGRGPAFALEYRISPADLREVGLEFTVDGDYYSAGLKIVTDSGVQDVRAQDGDPDLDVAGVRSLVFGNESERIRLSLAAPARLAVRGLDGAVSMSLLSECESLPEDGGDLVLSASLQTSFAEERERAVQMCGDGENLEDEGRLGEALNAYEEVLRELPFNERALVRARAGQQRVRSRAEEAIRTLEISLADATVLAQRDLYEKLHQSASRAADTYRNTSYGERAATIAGEAAAGLSEILAPLRRVEAERLLRTGREFLDSGRETLARAFLESLVRSYRDSEAAENARSDPRIQKLLEGSGTGGD